MKQVTAFKIANFRSSSTRENRVRKAMGACGIAAAECNASVCGTLSIILNHETP